MAPLSTQEMVDILDKAVPAHGVYVLKASDKQALQDNIKQRLDECEEHRECDVCDMLTSRLKNYKHDNNRIRDERSQLKMRLKDCESRAQKDKDDLNVCLTKICFLEAEIAKLKHQQPVLKEYVPHWYGVTYVAQTSYSYVYQPFYNVWNQWHRWR